MVNLLSETTITEREKLQFFSHLFKNPAEKLKIKKKKLLFLICEQWPESQ